MAANPFTRGVGRPLGATSWSRNLANVAAGHANLLLELWLAELPVREFQDLFRWSAQTPEQQAIIEECWRARDRGQRRYTVPPKIKRKLCQIAVAHVTEMRRQTILHHQNQAIESDLRCQGYSDGQIAEIMSRRVPERPHVEPPAIKKVLAVVNRRAPPGTLRRKAKDRVSHISPP